MKYMQLIKYTHTHTHVYKLLYSFLRHSSVDTVILTLRIWSWCVTSVESSHQISDTFLFYRCCCFRSCHSSVRNILAKSTMFKFYFFLWGRPFQTDVYKRTKMIIILNNRQCFVRDYWIHTSGCRPIVWYYNIMFSAANCKVSHCHFITAHILKPIFEASV
jgi:hypothetical protein